jgi:acyl-CoA thioesterase-1
MVSISLPEGTVRETLYNSIMRFVIFLLMLVMFACGQKSEDSHPQPAQTPHQADVKLPKIVAFGNSLTAGLGLPLNQSYPEVLQELVQRDGYKYEVVNAGVSGDTTSGGLRRLDWSLDGDVRFLIIELGANDVLRGQPVDLIKSNLASMIEKASKRNIKVYLVGMEAPSNAGPDYRKQVHQVYEDLRKKYQVTFIPFILKDLVGHEKLLQEDESHPTAEGARLIAENVYKELKPSL